MANSISTSMFILPSPHTKHPSSNPNTPSSPYLWEVFVNRCHFSSQIYHFLILYMIPFSSMWIFIMNLSLPVSEFIPNKNISNHFHQELKTSTNAPPPNTLSPIQLSITEKYANGFTPTRTQNWIFAK